MLDEIREREKGEVREVFLLQVERGGEGIGNAGNSQKKNKDRSLHRSGGGN